MNNFLPAKARWVKPGSMIRTNVPRVMASHAILPSDKGVTIAADAPAGVGITMPPYNDSMQGEGYIVTNFSSNEATIICPSSAQGIQGYIKRPNDETLVTSFPIEPGRSFTLFIETDGLAWIVT